ncbi:MAG: orotidine-5'-phosphate decarboxylase [Firmicutes bacterium]|nr:orotidine-5'-phosphate decarboxylase [Bacillota bacterium]MBR5000953.1 orotidine-5'-phosphate decarboxylase [Bacillota bacterium]MBR6500087.1 orotidine-5'-phosphate decarboxylase [Bacillota bacterium]
MIDQLIKKIKETGNPTVVGLDPTLVMIPNYLKKEMFEKYGKTPKAVAEMFVEFNRLIIDATYDLIPAVKPQIAMYEKFGLDGLDAYIRTCEYARSKGLVVIGDIKRGDIGSTAEAYAGHIDGCDIEGEHFDLWKEDYITINPYLGVDGIEPFLKVLRKDEKGIFVLVRTSNPSSGELQDKMMEDTYMYNQVADLVSKWGEDTIGEYGYSKVGAVVGATHPIQGVELRKRMPHTFFLVPGYGAQGGKGADLKGFFDENGVGCIVNSSRGIIAAYKKDAMIADPETVGPEFAEASRRAVIAMKEDLQNAF